MIEIGYTQTGNVVGIDLARANRHGCIFGATGTGKTVTLQRLAEGFSAAGVPVFCADVKGDLSGMSIAGARGGSAHKRAKLLKTRFSPTSFPVEFWDIFNHHGLPVKTSIQDIGAELMSAILRLNETQTGAMGICFKKAEDEQSWMLDLDDLRWSLNDMLEDREEVCRHYGNVTAASISAIQRNILALESQGGDKLFGEPPFKIEDLMKTDDRGRGYINLLHADRLMEAPKLYGGFMLWMLTELFRVMPETGDVEKPKMVFFFDEAHLLFRDAPKPLLHQIERLVRLIRSKGIGVFFVTQSPKEVPEPVLAQLGNRIQHALRAFTPGDRRMIKASADAFRPNPDIKVRAVITELGIGEALVSFLDVEGIPAIVERVKVLPPRGHIGQVTDVERAALMSGSSLKSKYIVHLESHVESYEFNRRMKEQRNIPIEADDGPQPYEPGLYREHVPTYYDNDSEKERPSAMQHLRSVIIWGAFAAGCWYVLIPMLV